MSMLSLPFLFCLLFMSKLYLINSIKIVSEKERVKIQNISSEKTIAQFELLSNDIFEKLPINDQFTPIGEDINPGFSWNNPPKNTKSFAFLVDDPDAPSGLFNHWCLVNISSDIFKIKKNSIPKNSVEVENSWGIKKYKGPNPPNHQLHNYHFKLYALKSTFENVDKLKLNYVRQFLEVNTIEMAEIIAPYRN